MGPRLVNLGENELATSSRILRNELGAVGEGAGERAAQGVGKVADSARHFIPPAEVSKLFSTPEKAIQHFTQHGGKVSKALGESSYDFARYMADANHTIRNGTYVTEKNAYVRLIGGTGDAAKYAFVGLDRETGAITTFHIKYVTELIREAPSLGLSR